MYDNYNYEDSIRTIKSALFDIYEHQEIIVGAIEDDKEREKHVNKYIDVKNSALELVAKIEELYGNKKNTMQQKDQKKIKENESIDDSSKDINTEEPEIVEESDIEDDNIEDSDSNIDEDELIEAKKSLEKYYLDDRNGNKPNFAYVPMNLYEKIKNHKSDDDNKLYKQDDIERKGIIVRNDQFMKLSLSKHRQEGVLKEAKIYRIEQAKKSRLKLENI